MAKHTLPPAISVIIPTLNEEKYLPILLHSLNNIDAPLEVIVVDGNSEDTTQAVVEELQHEFTDNHTLKLIPLNKRGIALQRNTGAKQAANDILLFCDADIIAPNTVMYRKIILDFVEHHHVVASPKIVPIERNIKFLIMFFGQNMFQRILGLFGRPYFTGQCLLTTKAVFLSVGGFDQELSVGEDLDYSLRVSKLGTFKHYGLPVQVSTRRFQKYGVLWMLRHPFSFIRLATQGKVTKDDKIFYPFGDY